MVLKQFHSQMDYAFEATQICTYMIIDHASGLSTDKATDLFNKTSAQSSRNYDIQSIIKNQDSGFIRELMKCFPAKAVEVKNICTWPGTKTGRFRPCWTEPWVECPKPSTFTEACQNDGLALYPVWHSTT